jgi:hypothetical protein
MGVQVVAGASLRCSFGMAPVVLAVTPASEVLAGGAPAARISDMTLASISTFGMCQAPTNPAVQAATSSAGGTPTPAPCAPLLAAPWQPGSPDVLIGGTPALVSGCVCMCNWLGVINVTTPGQAAVLVDSGGGGGS